MEGFHYAGVVKDLHINEKAGNITPPAFSFD